MDHTALFHNLPTPAAALVYRDGVAFVRAINAAFAETFDVAAETARGESLDSLLDATDRSETSDGDPPPRLAPDPELGDYSHREVRFGTDEGTRAFLLRYVPTDGEADYVAVFEELDAGTPRGSETGWYEPIVEHTEDGIYVFDQEGTVEFVNQRVVDVSGLAYETWIGEHVSVLEDLGTLTSVEVARLEAGIAAVASGEEDEVREVLAPDLPHDLDYLEVRLAPLPVEGEPDRVLAFSRDVTEHRVRERELERKNERLDRFASLVSHDLRNPLHVAEGRLELAREECESEHLEGIASAHDRMATLIEDLLTLARQGDRLTEVEPVDLGTLARRCWGTVQTPTGTLTVVPGPTILADRTATQTLLENLIRNAVEHGGDDVTVTIGPLEDDEGFYVGDDGPGIPPSERDSVFEAGYSTTPTTIGLVSRRIVSASARRS
ncbi:MAG: PAS domain-containing protein, partial [Haloarculaceae archaeon]